MSQIHKSSDDSFTLMSRGRAFCRGLLSAQPLVEVARVGVVHNLPEDKQIAYAKRLNARASPAMLSELLRSGEISEITQILLAFALAAKGTEEHAFEVLICKELTSANAESTMAAKIESGMLAYILLKGRRITSHAAQDILAHTLKESGLHDRAAEILLHGSVGSDTAKRHMAEIIPPDHATLHKLVLFGELPDDVRFVLSLRMPPICTPLDDE